MGIKYTAGFTIIETMLFLAISGVLVVALLAGTGASINIQRYHDSLATLQTVLQDQYSQVANVRNESPDTVITCDSSTGGVASSGGGSPTNLRGQGDCVVIGRQVVIVDSNITTNTIVGYSTNSSSNYSTDISELKDYKLSILPEKTIQSSLEWGTKIAWGSQINGAYNGHDFKKPTTPRSINILILRSPKSGLIYTFTSDSENSSLSSMIVAGNDVPGQSERRVCVDADGLFQNGLAILLAQNASSASAVETRSNDMGDALSC